MAASVKRIAERVQSPFSGSKVDREAGVITGVLLCGTTSANNRDYDRKSFGDLKQYENRPVYMNHGRERLAQDKVGWVCNPRFRADGRPEADLHFLVTHQNTAAFLEAAERNPAMFGLSHVALCKTARGRDGRERVEAVQEVESVDLVADPATTKGFFESVRRPAVQTLQQVAEAFARLPKATTRQILAVKRLAEMDGMAGVAMDAPPAEEVDPAEGVKGAFSTACMHICEQALGGDMDPKEALQKLKRLIAAHGEVSDRPADSEGDDTESESDDEGAEVPKSESRVADTYADCLAEGYTPSERLFKYLATLPADERKAFIREQKQPSPAERPVSAARRPAAAVKEATTPRGESPPTLDDGPLAWHIG